MSGPANDRGVNTRALGELFERTQAKSATTRNSITVSLLEVYNEDIRDLLVAGGSTEKLEVRQGDQGNHVPGLTIMAVETIQVESFLLVYVILFILNLMSYSSFLHLFLRLLCIVLFALSLYFYQFFFS
jgi:Kinesin motor domain